ncbi:hypothetical protein ACFW5K_19930 [Streptomyces albidoflavus]
MEGYAVSTNMSLQGLLGKARRGGWSVQWEAAGGEAETTSLKLTMRRDGSRSLRFTLLTDALGTGYLARAAVELTTDGHAAWSAMVPSAAVAKLEAAP